MLALSYLLALPQVGGYSLTNTRTHTHTQSFILDSNCILVPLWQMAE